MRRINIKPNNCTCGSDYICIEPINFGKTIRIYCGDCGRYTIYDAKCGYWDREGIKAAIEKWNRLIDWESGLHIKQFIYQFKEKPWQIGVLRANDYKDAIDKLIAEYGKEDGTISMEEIYPNGYKENGVQRKICVYYEVIEEV